METASPARATSSAATAGRWCSSGARRRTRCSRPSSKPCSRPATRSPTTSTVTARRASPRFDRNIHRGRRLSAVAGLPPPGDGPPQPRRRHAGAWSRAWSVRRHRATGVEYTHVARPTPRRSTPARSSCAAARSTRRSCCSCRASATPTTCGARRRRRAPPPRRRRAHAGPPRGVHPARVHPAGVAQPAAEVAPPTVDRAAVAVPPRPRRDEPLRGGRLRAQQRRRRLPQPDVPLPAHRHPLRRVGAGAAATATRCTSGRCTPTRAARCRSRRPTRR